MTESVSVEDPGTSPKTAGHRFSTADFDYPLDESLIAQRPLPRREASRMLLVRRCSGALEDRTFAELPELIETGDVLVLNDTRVFPARFLGRKPTGAPAEILLIERVDDEGWMWRALVRPGSKLKPGRVVQVADDLEIVVEGSLEGGARLVRLATSQRPDEAIARHGRVPLPPYIRRPDDEVDRERYQTVYARETGSVAAPTAGLHFSGALVRTIEGRGARAVRLTLHVGPGTFRPVEAEDPSGHRLQPEWYRVTREAADAINRARAAGGSIWAVGTTSVRTLETVVSENGIVRASEGRTDLFIRPGHRFTAVDRLITNFHLPRSTLLMLVAAFAGYELTMAAYRHALDERYRFYSYGDSMVVL